MMNLRLKLHLSDRMVLRNFKDSVLDNAPFKFSKLSLVLGSLENTISVPYLDDILGGVKDWTDRLDMISADFWCNQTCKINIQTK